MNALVMNDCIGVCCGGVYVVVMVGWLYRCMLWWCACRSDG
jgi:hypothetical protein